MRTIQHDQKFHTEVPCNSRRVGVVVIVVVVVHTFKNGLTFERLDRFTSYLEGSCIRVSRFTSYAYTVRNSWDLHLQRYHLPILCHSNPKLCGAYRKTCAKKIQL